jgi:pimeloyl-ACP methyl ester carboxylesterase
VQTKIKQSCEGQEATGPTVILVDAAGNFRGFSPMPELAEALAPDFAVFTYDRRGKGASTDTLPYAVDREFDDLQALIGLAGGSAFVHGFSSGATLALLAAEHGLGIAKLSLLEPPLQVDATPPPAAPGISGEVARLIIAGRRGDAYEHWMRGIGVPAEMIAQMRDGPLWPALEATAHGRPRPQAGAAGRTADGQPAKKDPVSHDPHRACL